MSPRAESLTLEVTGAQADELGVARRRVFGTQGGTIGRGPGNHWVLADAYVSSRHAAIEYRDETFFIEDLNSRNGVFVNGQRLESGRPVALHVGDQVFIEPYEIVTSVDAGAGQSDTAGRSKGPLAVGPPSIAPYADLRDLVEPDVVSADNWLDKLAPPDGIPRKAQRSGLQSVSRDPLQEAVVPPVPRPTPPAAPLIPHDYDPLADSQPGTGSDTDPFAAAASHGGPLKGSGERRRADRRRGETPPSGDGGAVDLRALLAGAGLEGVALSPEVAEQLGQILRVVVEGLLDVLKSRQEIKDEFRIRHTVMKRRGNNPLKFAVDVEDALHNLLVKKNPGYLGPVAAFEDAFSDVRHHQMAMLAGVRDAFERMFAQFHPERLQQEFNRHTPRRGGLQVLQSKPDYWEFYRDFVQRLASDPDGSFRTLFGEEFAKAYERQLDGLKTEAHTGKAHGRGRGAQER